MLFIVDLANYTLRMAPIVYTSEGAHIAKVLWNETLTELSFAGVDGIIQRIGD